MYDAFGQQLIGLTTDPYGYKGQYGYYTDRPATNRTDLILTTFRYYDPDTGRFLTRDPIGYSGGLNLYGYVEGNPVNYVDPIGLTAWRVTIINRLGVVQHQFIRSSNFDGDKIEPNPPINGYGFGFYPAGFPVNCPGEIRSPQNIYDESANNECPSKDRIFIFEKLPTGMWEEILNEELSRAVHKKAPRYSLLPRVHVCTTWVFDTINRTTLRYLAEKLKEAVGL